MINEFVGETFTCESGSSACVKTGEQVLANYSFDKESIQESCFGLGMVMLGFTCAAVFFLQISKISYVDLNFVGNKYSAFETKKKSS